MCRNGKSIFLQWLTRKYSIKSHYFPQYLCNYGYIIVQTLCLRLEYVIFISRHLAAVYEKTNFWTEMLTIGLEHITPAGLTGRRSDQEKTWSVVSLIRRNIDSSEILWIILNQMSSFISRKNLKAMYKRGEFHSLILL